MQILGHHAVLRGRERKADGQGILCSGTLEVQVLYITASDRRPFGGMVLSIPYSQLIEVEDFSPGDAWEVHEMLDQIFLTVPESGKVEVRGTILLNVCVMDQRVLENITGVSAQAYDMQEYKKKPGMRIHFVQPQETLWTIARENRSTVENIKKLNELSADEVTPGQKLILLKQAAESLP